jgi:hypothetical protein
MVISYASAVDDWPEWQQAFRYGLILIYPPDPPLGAVNRLRMLHDPRSQGICDAHITLTRPLPRPMTESLWHGLEAVASRFEPFTIHYGPLRHYLPYPGVCLAIEPEDQLGPLRSALEATAAFADAGPRRGTTSSHMTIAEFITEARTLELIRDLVEVAPEGDFECTSVSYAVPDDSFHFTERSRLALGPTFAGRREATD